jgi:CBS domain containing-hemolysin-like protein
MPFATGAAVDVQVGPWTAVWVLALFAASFFFSGTETSYFSLQKVDREVVGRQGRTGRIVHMLLQRRAPLITTILLGNEIANTALAATGAAIVVALAPGQEWLNVVLLTPLLVLISEITPKVLAFRFPRGWARVAAWPLLAFYVLVWPVRFVFSALIGTLGRMLGADHELQEGVAEEELMVYVDRGAATGELDPMERDMIEAVFEFDDLTVERLMTPRPDMFTLPVATPWEALLQAVREAGHSRIPVTGATADDIVGVLLLKDLLKYRRAPFSGPRQLRSLLLPPVFVPASKAADSMLREFLERRYHMAFVVDEHGTLVGLITLDDLLEELLGEDEDTEESEIARLRPDALTVKASIDVEDFAEETGIALPEGDYHTVGGFVFHQLGHLPRKGDAVVLGGHRFVVSQMEGRRIAELVVHTAQEAAG